ncbi:hypothetical protein PIB30_096999 [Stylosanthes scabra]|uniref:Putative plant transposon protein domain-containing protein n=1 Tax=Stylosanthes scabra TaxID=79078 RepID=A0ABU6TX16_9FABA|nr:hypothetical protein [Stylosanthes scabra]
MASSSNVSRKIRGKAVVVDEEFDAYMFKTAFHQQFYNSYVASKDIIPDTKFNLEEGEFLEIQQQMELRGWKRLAKPKLKVSQSIIREFYANARINKDSDEDQPYFQTFVRGEVLTKSWKMLFKIYVCKDQLGYWGQEIIHCTSGAVTYAHSREVGMNLSSITYCQPLISEVTMKKAVLIHCIIHGQIVRVERIIAEAIIEIVKDLHTTRHPLAFPNVIARLYEGAKVDY